MTARVLLLVAIGLVASVYGIQQPDGTVIPVDRAEQFIEQTFAGEGDNNLDYRVNAHVPDDIDVSTKALVFKIVQRDAAYKQVFAWYDIAKPDILYPLHSCQEQPPGLPTTQLDVRPNSPGTGPKSESGRIGIAAIINTDFSSGYCASLIDKTYVFRTYPHTIGTPYQLLEYTSTNFPGRRWYALEDIENGGDNDFNDLLIWIDFVEVGSVCTVQADGTSCSDADQCTLGETCTGDTCGNPTYTVDCGTTDKCHNPGNCDPATGFCSYPTPRRVATDGSACPSDFPCVEETCGQTPSRFGCPIKYLSVAEQDECGSSGGHAMWSAYYSPLPQGWGEDRWYFSEVEGIPTGTFQEFSEGFARIHGILLGYHDPNNQFEILLELEYVGASLDGTPYEIKNELHSSCADKQKGWWFYKLRTDVPSYLKGAGNYLGVTVDLGLEGTGKMIVQVGKGASMKNIGWGLTTWLTYQGFTFDAGLWPSDDVSRPRPNFYLPQGRHNDGDLNMNTKCCCKCHRTTPVCGNGIVENGEECDGGDCCNSICRFREQGFECRLAKGECDKTEVCNGASAVCPPDSYYDNTRDCQETIGFCDARITNKCSGTDVHCRGVPRLSLGQQKVPWENFNVVSFQDFYGPGGDVEGRLAVCRDLNVAGFTVGYKTNSFSREDNQLDFALFVGHNAKYQEGSVHPDGNTPSTKEDIFVGDTFIAPLYLQERRTGFSTYIGDRDAECSDAQTYFTNLQNNFASQTPNVHFDILGGTGDGLLLHCHDSTAKWYYVNIPAETMSVLNWYQLDSCNLAAYWIVNIVGTGNVLFKGDRWPSVVERLVYNVIGSGRTINVETGLFGNLLAPNNILVQKTGVTQGLVVVGNVQYLLQANKPNCIEFDTIIVTGWAAGTTVRGEYPSKKRGTANQVSIIPVFAYGSFTVGDQVNVNGEENCTIIGVTQYGGSNAIVCQPPLTKDYPPNTKFTTKVAFTSTDEIVRAPLNGTVINGIIPVTPAATGSAETSVASTVAALASLFVLCCLALIL